MRRLALCALFLTLSLAGPNPWASGSPFLVCYSPDDEAPIIFDIEVKPSPALDLRPTVPAVASTDAGTFVRAHVWDMPNVDPTMEHNGIVRTLLVLDGTRDVEMQPADGDIGDLREDMRAVLPPQTFTPGLHTLTFVAADTCGNVRVRELVIYQLTFAVTGTCETAPAGFCDAIDAIF